MRAPYRKDEPMPDMFTTQPSSHGDLKVTFELEGQAATFYLDQGRIEGNEKEILSQLGCALCCTKKSGFAACLAYCLVSGRCCDGGIEGQNCVQVG